MPGIYTRLCSGLLFPLHEWAKGHHTLRVKCELEETQWWAPERLHELQLARLRELLMHAKERVPYYRDLFAGIGFDPSGIGSPADLAGLPFLTKDTIRANGDRLKSDDAKALKRLSTTGSSGDPLQFHIGPARVTHDVAAKWRATRWWGVDIGDPEIVAWSSPIELSTQDRVRRVRDRLFRTRLLSTQALTIQKMDQFLNDIRIFRPKMLFGYPSSLTLIAQRASERGLRMDDLGVKVAFVTAERTYPHQRDVIGQVFRCAVADGYGGRDSGFIAHECPAGGLHITAEDIMVEIVDGEGRLLPPGQAGEVVVTQLFTHDFPFIRYKNGDVAVLDNKVCSCGRGLPLIREVQGRTNDFLVSANGGRIHDIAFAMLLRDMPGVRQFKIIQETLQEVRLQLVTGPDFDRPRQKSKIESVFRNHLGDGLKLNIDYVSRIEPERTGKYRYVISHVAGSVATETTVVKFRLDQ